MLKAEIVKRQVRTARSIEDLTEEIETCDMGYEDTCISFSGRIAAHGSDTNDALLEIHRSISRLIDAVSNSQQ